MPKLIKLHSDPQSLFRIVGRGTKNTRVQRLDVRTFEPVDDTSFLVPTSDLNEGTSREYFLTTTEQDNHNYPATWVEYPDSPEIYQLADLMSISDEKRLARIRRRNCEYSERVPVEWLRDYEQVGGTKQVVVFDR